MLPLISDSYKKKPSSQCQVKITLTKTWVQQLQKKSSLNYMSETERLSERKNSSNIFAYSLPYNPPNNITQHFFFRQQALLNPVKKNI